MTTFGREEEDAWGQPSRQNWGGKIGDNFVPEEITIFEMLE